VAKEAGVTIGEAIGGILPLAIAVDISVLSIIAVILMLITPRARSNGPAFVAGWVLGLVVVGGLVLIIANAANVSSSSGPSTAAYAIKLTLGVLLLLLAVRQWRSRPRPGEQAPAPKWMAALDSFTPVKSLGLGAAMSGVNPKNLVLTAAAAISIAQTGLPGGQQAAVLAVFIVVGTVTVAAPLVVYLALGRKADSMLNGWREWLAANNAAIMIVVFLVFGFVLIGQGIAGLS
jgi:threonine/homoserine/homoserine lactone efflux protein